MFQKILLIKYSRNSVWENEKFFVKHCKNYLKNGNFTKIKNFTNQLNQYLQGIDKIWKKKLVKMVYVTN